MSNMTDGYIDIRLHVTFEAETWQDIDGTMRYDRAMVDASPEIINWQDIKDHELQGIAESLTQMDRHQEMLANDIPAEIYNVVPEDPFNE